MAELEDLERKIKRKNGNEAFEDSSSIACLIDLNPNIQNNI
ncbi:MAG: hypothetical protein ABSD92_09395 [Candidatus Bathyarchaeia archaeon]